MSTIKLPAGAYDMIQLQGRRSQRLYRNRVACALSFACLLVFGAYSPLNRGSDLGVPDNYQNAVAKLMLAEASFTCTALSLDEQMPLKRESLAGVFVTPPALNRFNGGFPAGTIRTEKHVFSFASQGKLTSCGRLDLLNHAKLSNKELSEEYKKRAVPASQIDTNSAWMAMQPFLQSGIMDVARLNRECELQLSALQWGEYHVPKYYAIWSKNNKPVASVTILMPDKVLLSFRIEDPQCNLRPSIQLGEPNDAAEY